MVNKAIGNCSPVHLGRAACGESLANADGRASMDGETRQQEALPLNPVWCSLWASLWSNEAHKQAAKTFHTLRRSSVARTDRPDPKLWSKMLPMQVQSHTVSSQNRTSQTDNSDTS